MKFDELDARMRVFETNSDQFVLPDIYIVARLDGRGFTRMTKEVHAFEPPFDERFRDLMLDTTEALVSEFHAVYGYTQSDEISLLFPVRGADDYSFFVDGRATVESGGGVHRLALMPTRAVFHRHGPAPDPNSSCAADCVPVLRTTAPLPMSPPR